MKVVLKWISNLITFLMFALLLAMVFLVITARASGGEPNVFGYQLKTVMSGSMEPTIQTGSIIAVKPVEDPSHLQKDDVITYVNPDNQLVTHRIVDVMGSGEQTQFVTKGDNNEEADMNPVLAQNVVAEYTGFTIPYLGYFIDFAKSQNGTVILLIVPGILLVIYSAFTIWSALRMIESKSSTRVSKTGRQIEQE